MTTWLRKCVSLALMVASLALGATSVAQGQRRAQRADYDRRASMNLRAAPNQVQIEALAALREDLDGSLLESVDSSSGVTHSLFNPVGKLTLPNAGDPLDIAVSFINDHLALLGLEEGDVDEIRVCDVVYSGVSGATHVYLCQQHKGVEVFQRPASRQRQQRWLHSQRQQQLCARVEGEAEKQSGRHPSGRMRAWPSRITLAYEREERCGKESFFAPPIFRRSRSSPSSFGCRSVATSRWLGDSSSTRRTDNTFMT